MARLRLSVPLRFPSGRTDREDASTQGHGFRKGGYEETLAAIAAEDAVQETQAGNRLAMKKLLAAHPGSS